MLLNLLDLLMIPRPLSSLPLLHPHPIPHFQNLIPSRRVIIIDPKLRERDLLEMRQCVNEGLLLVLDYFPHEIGHRELVNDLFSGVLLHEREAFNSF